MAPWYFPHALWVCNTRRPNTSLGNIYLTHLFCHSESAAITRTREQYAILSFSQVHTTWQHRQHLQISSISRFPRYYNIPKYSSDSFSCFEEVQYTYLPALQEKNHPQINQILIKNTDLNMQTHKMIFSLWISHMMIDSVGMSMGNSLQTAFQHANVGSTVFCNPQNCWVSKLFEWFGILYITV